MIKKFLAIILLTTLSISILSSCKGCKKNDFVEVYSVTFTVDGKKTSKYSSASMDLSLVGFVSKSEYDAVEEKYKISSPNLTESLSPYVKTVSSVCGLNNSDKGKYVYHSYYNMGSVVYAVYLITSGINHDYVSVKVIDDDTIIIRSYGSETTYNVSSYSITYFYEY